MGTIKAKCNEFKVKIGEFLKARNWDLICKIYAIGLGAVGGIYAIVYFITQVFPQGQSKFYTMYFLLPLIIMLALTAYLAVFFVTKKDFKYSRMYLILALGWSIAIQFMMPPITGADEVKHYYSAYHASNILLGIKDVNIEQQFSDWIPGESYFFMRAEDYYSLPYVDVTFPYQYQILADGVWFNCPDNTQAYVPVYEAPGQARRYLASGLGIAIARKLNFGFSGTIFLGRFFNSLTLIIGGWICMLLLPVGKPQMISFSLFPTVLELFGSYSYDNMSIMLSIMLLAMCLHYSAPGVKLRAIHLYIMAATLALLMPNKIVYVTFAIWILCIPLKKWWELLTCKKWYEYGLLAIFFGFAAFIIKKVVVRYYWIAYSNIMWRLPGSTIDQDGRESYTRWYIKDHPWETVKFAWEGIKLDFWYNIKHVVGAQLGHVRLNIEVPMFCTMLILIVFIIGLFIRQGKGIGKRQFAVVAIGVLVCIVCIFVGCLFRFTPAEGSERIQISYRYLIPAYFALSVAAGTDAKENRASLACIYAQNFGLILVMCHAFQYLYHLRDEM